MEENSKIAPTWWWEYFCNRCGDKQHILLPNHATISKERLLLSVYREPFDKEPPANKPERFVLHDCNDGGVGVAVLVGVTQNFNFSITFSFEESADLHYDQLLNWATGRGRDQERDSMAVSCHLPVPEYLGKNLLEVEKGSPWLSLYNIAMSGAPSPRGRKENILSWLRNIFG